MSTRLEAEAVEFVRELIRIDSVNTGNPETIGDGETRAAIYVRDRLREVGIEGELIEPLPGRGSFVARIPGADRSAGALLVHAHLDVVPVAAEDWAHDPFGGEIVDGQLYGRGAVDMKNFAGVILAVAREFARAGRVPRRDLVLAFLADEENGGTWGADWLVAHRPDLFAGVTEAISEVGGFSVPFAAADSGRPRRAYLAATSEKGVAWVTLRARGRAGHGSRPTDDNPVVRIGQAVARIGAHRFPIVRTPALEGFLAAFGEARGLEFSDASLEADLAELGFVGSLVGATVRNTATPTVLAGGGKANIIPGEATARLDLRVLPGQDVELRAELQRLAGPDVTVEEELWWSATDAPVDAPVLRACERAIAHHDPEGVVVPYLLPASTDNKHFARLGIHGYGFVPLRVPEDFDVFAQFHAADEHVPVDALEFSARVTAEILAEA